MAIMWHCKHTQHTGVNFCMLPTDWSNVLIKDSSDAELHKLVLTYSIHIFLNPTTKDHKEIAAIRNLNPPESFLVTMYLGRTVFAVVLNRDLLPMLQTYNMYKYVEKWYCDNLDRWQINQHPNKLEWTFLLAGYSDAPSLGLAPLPVVTCRWNHKSLYVEKKHLPILYANKLIKFKGATK